MKNKALQTRLEWEAPALSQYLNHYNLNIKVCLYMMCHTIVLLDLYANCFSYMNFQELLLYNKINYSYVSQLSMFIF